MTTATTFFDTHETIKQLILSGFTEKQAESQVKLQLKTFLLNQKEQSTIKKDLHSLKITTNNLTTDISHLKVDIEHLQTEQSLIKEDLNSLKATTNQIKIDVDKLRIDTEHEFIRLLSKLDNFVFSSRSETFENRSVQVVHEDSKKVNDEEIKQKYQFRKKSILLRQEIDQKFTYLDTKFTGKFSLLYWMVGGVLTMLSPLLVNEVTRLYSFIVH